MGSQTRFQRAAPHRWAQVGGGTSHYPRLPASLRCPPQVFEEYVEDSEEKLVVTRDPSMSDNAQLPGGWAGGRVGVPWGGMPAAVCMLGGRGRGRRE